MQIRIKVNRIKLYANKHIIILFIVSLRRINIIIKRKYDILYRMNIV